MENNLCIVIKAPNQKYDDLKVKCEPTWTILDLKKHLSTEYPSKPKLGDQRLIYSGHLLKDTQHLNEIIGPSDDNQHTFHLVVPHRATGPTNSSAASTSAESNEATTNNNNNNNNNNNSTNNIGPRNVPPNSPLGPNWPYEIPPMLRSAYRPINPNDNNLVPEAYDPMVQQYMQWMTSYYHMFPPSSLASYETYMLNHYYNSYQQFNNNSNNNRINENPLSGNVNNNINNNDNNNNNNNNNDLDAEEGGDRGNRNWAETMASVSKVMMLMGIIYFYTSLGRLLLLALIVLIVYLYRYVVQQNDMLNNNNNQPQQQQPPQAVFQGQPDEVNNNNNNNNNNEPDEQAPREGEGNNFEDGSTNVRLNGLRLVWVFVSSLFTSLIPDPVPMN